MSRAVFPASPQSNERPTWAILIALGAVVLFASVVLGDIGSRHVRIVANDLGSVLAGLVAAGLALRAARAQTLRTLRLSWLCFAGAFAAWSLGDVLWAVTELVYGRTPGGPGLEDLAYLATLPLAIAGTLLRPSLQPSLLSRRTMLADMGIAAAALLAVCWALVVGPLLAWASLGSGIQLVTFGYPVADLVILGCLVIAILREPEGGPATIPLALALAVLTAGDLLYAVLVVRGAYVTGHPVDVVWFAALALFALAASCESRDISDAIRHTSRRRRLGPRLPSVRTPGPFAARKGPLWRLALPTVLVMLASIVVAMASLQRGTAAIGLPVLFLALAWLLLFLRVLLGLQRATDRQQRERRLRVGHASSFRREQQRRQQLEAIRDVTTELTRELDLTALLSLITRRTAGLVDAPIGTVLLWEAHAERLIPRAWHGLDDWFADIHFASGEGAVGRAIELQRGVIVNNYPTARERSRVLLEQTSIEAAIAAPIISQGRLLGVIGAADGRAGRTFDDNDLKLLELFADQAAVAIEHARLVDEAAGVEALRELSRLKTELLSTVSHELRTPLTLIHGYAELLQARARTLSPDDVRMMADEVLLGSRTMIRLVDDLLDFTRLESTRLNLVRARVDLAELVRRHVKAWQHQAGGERLRVETEGAPETHADLTRLDQVIRNLVSNALHHAPSGPVVVRAGHDPGWAWLEVEDAGPGIPDDELPRIWDSFFRGERARNSPNRGSGLGLSVVRQLVELHQGKIDVRSTLGQGTTFRVWLPSAPPNGTVLPDTSGLALLAATDMLRTVKHADESSG
ncbi:MAG: GAF domain-containing sensor histidine kinase [Chloroflexi bacterium]|nr:GAF domain-containing sensor histidine kinase [Chloroflexota bacterium]